VGGQTVIIRLNSVQLQLQLPAGTELGNMQSHCHLTTNFITQITRLETGFFYSQGN
jgi:hypothetical protein